MMTNAQVVETSVTVNNNMYSPMQDYVHPAGLLYSTYLWNDSWVQPFHNISSTIEIVSFKLFQILVRLDQYCTWTGL